MKSRHACTILLLMSIPAISVVASETIRFATFNTSLNRNKAGALQEELEGGNSDQARKIAQILQRVRPDVVLLNEVDYDSSGKTAQLFRQHYLEVSQGNQPPLHYQHTFLAPVNTGIPSGIDLDRNGETGQAGDAFGFGRFPGQYGMLILSRYPIDENRARTFQQFPWKKMPGALLPVDPSSSEPYYLAEAGSIFRLSSKSHWDVPIRAGENTIHLLASHPTPPVFDGPEDRNGRRNHDEIRLWADYIRPSRSNYLVDDQGQRGGLARGAHFVIAGDMNADPLDGDTVPGAIGQLLDQRRVNSRQIPASRGAVAFRDTGANAKHRGSARNDTADFADQGPGNLRVDYVLPSRSLRVLESGVFWPPAGEPASALLDASDHRLVWVDVRFK
ncbi:MAG: endonuclease/exonuclease/phosphatase family protein [Planctomycetota bacterium]|nr:endonuclease/exonuclease/phosphatase family protein [Planctomycetota bacterium]